MPLITILIVVTCIYLMTSYCFKAVSIAYEQGKEDALTPQEDYDNECQYALVELQMYAELDKMVKLKNKVKRKQNKSRKPQQSQELTCDDIIKNLESYKRM